MHVINGSLRVIQKQFSKKNDFGAFLKTACTLTCIILYIPAILNIFVEQDNDQGRFPDISHRQDCPSIRRLFNFRLFEIYVFFSQILSIFVYVLLAKIYLKIKKPTTRSEAEEDPFYQLVKNGTNDFLASENFIMQCVTL